MEELESVGGEAFPLTVPTDSMWELHKLSVPVTRSLGPMEMSALEIEPIADSLSISLNSIRGVPAGRNSNTLIARSHIALSNSAIFPDAANIPRSASPNAGSRRATRRRPAASQWEINHSRDPSTCLMILMRVYL